MHVNLDTRFVACMGLWWKGNRWAAVAEKWVASQQDTVGLFGMVFVFDDPTDEIIYLFCSLIM